MVDYLEARMGYFLDPDKSSRGINREDMTINRLAEAMDIDNLLLQHVIDYMQRENKVTFFSDILYEKDGQTIWAKAIVLTESVENYKARVEREKKKRPLGGCGWGCILLILAFLLFCLMLSGL